MVVSEHGTQKRKIVRWEGYSASLDEYPAFMTRLATQIELNVEEALQEKNAVLDMRFYRKLYARLPELSHGLLRFVAQANTNMAETAHQREIILWYYACRIAVTIINRLQRDYGASALDWEDFLQDVQIRIIAAFKTLSPSLSDRELELFRSHMYGSMVDRGQRLITHRVPTQYLDRGDEKLVMATTPEQSYEHIELIRFIGQTITRYLSNYQQEVLYRYFAFGQTQDEIYALMGLSSTDRVKSLLAQGLRKIRWQINKYYSRGIEQHERFWRIIRDEQAIAEAIGESCRSNLGIYDEVASPFPFDTRGLSK